MNRLNKNQKWALWAGLAIILLMILFPPWAVVVTMGGLTDGTNLAELQVTKSIGYGFLFSPPDDPELTLAGFGEIKILAKRLLLQIVAVAGLTVGAVFMLKGSGRQAQPD